MNIANMLPAPVLACGACIDTGLTGDMPFLFYWLLCLPVWSLIAGPLCLAIARRRGDIKARTPLWLFLGLVVSSVVGAPVLMGAVVAPIIIILPFWGVAIGRALRQPNMVWRRANQILLAVLLFCIPVSYLVPVKPYEQYRERLRDHERRSQQSSGSHSSKAAGGLTGNARE